MVSELRRDQVIYAMSNENEAVLRVSPGERIIFHTEDCFSHALTEPHHVLGPDFDYSKVNPATGPVWIEGAEPGDVLRVHIEEVFLDAQGVVEVYPGFGPLGDEVAEGYTEIVSLSGKEARFCGRSFSLRPMIGVIGVAPAEGSVLNGSPGRHGGNLDTLENTAGSVLRLPIFVPGAKLALGDLHGVMGNGEVCGTGAEARGRVTLRAELEKNTPLRNPFVETEEAYFLLASAESMENATREVVEDTVAFVQRHAGLSWEQGYMFASLFCDLAFSQVVNPLKTAKMRIPKKALFAKES